MLGCSRCRHSVNGCSRCRNPTFKPRVPRCEVSQQSTATDSLVQLHEHTSAHQQRTLQYRNERRRKQRILIDAVPHSPPQPGKGNQLEPAARHAVSAEAFASTLQARIQQQLAAGRTAALHAATSPRKKLRGGDAGVKASVAAADKPSIATLQGTDAAVFIGQELPGTAAVLQSGQDLSLQAQQQQQPCLQHLSRTGRTEKQQGLARKRSSKTQQQQQQQQQPHPNIVEPQEPLGASGNKKREWSACASVPAQVASCEAVSPVVSPKLTPLQQQTPPPQKQQQQQQQQMHAVHLSPAPSPAVNAVGLNEAANASSLALFDSSMTSPPQALLDSSLTSPPHTLKDVPPSTRKGSKRGAPKVHPYAHLVLPGVDPRKALVGWQAPPSPYGLLEEELWRDPWRLLLGCMLLNKTSGRQVRKVFWKLLEVCPTPEAAVAADVAAIRDIIAPLGLHNKRAVAVQRLSHDFMHKQWTCPTELHGIGKYAADAYYIFCRGQWQGVQPDDKDLIKYHEWLRATGGQGMALQPDSVADVEIQPAAEVSEPC